jgi:hypothetical protein
MARSQVCRGTPSCANVPDHTEHKHIIHHVVNFVTRLRDNALASFKFAATDPPSTKITDSF